MTQQERQERSKYFTPEEDIAFNMVDESTVKRLQRNGDIKLPKKKVDIPKDQRWNTKQMHSKLMQGILNGDSIQKLSKSLMDVIGNNVVSATRNARTMMTEAENAGRLDSYKDLDEQGVVQKKVWIATPDDRTRASHVDIDGEEVDINESFSNGCMCPGDSDGPAEEVWNCRCSMRDHIVGFRRADGSISYVGHERDKTMHDEQMDEEKERRESQKSDKTNDAYAFIGAPVFRPRASDFGGYTDEFYEAREQYRQEKAEREQRLEQWYNDNVNQNPMSMDELKEWCDKNGVVIYGSLDGLDGVALRNYTERYEQLAKDFPIVKMHHDRLGYPFEIAYNSTASYDAEATHGMTFGRAYSNYREHVMLEGMQSANGVDLVMGANPAVRTFDHEFGHQVYDALKRAYDKDVFDSTKEEIQRRIDMERDLIKNVYNKKGMSDYATTNDDELFAEAFAAWYGGEKTEFAEAFGDFLKRWMK